MSRIQEILDGIRRFLAGGDHSNTPQLRKLAEAYAAACTDLNSRLAECRRLIESGLWLDAARLNGEFKPPLSERARQLVLPEKERFDELCRLYGYPEAPGPDLATAEALQTSSESGEQFNKLVLRWRKIARENRPGEKVRLLRRILAALPGDGDDLWRANLRHAEQQWIAEVEQNAHAALAEGRFEQLEEWYQALTDPELLTPVPMEILSRFKPAMLEYQRRRCRRQTEAGLDELARAYSALESDRTAKLLEEWDKAATHPLFEASPEELRQIEEVRGYVLKTAEIRRVRREFEDRTRELIAELDRHGNFTVIENLYETLRQTDLPIDARLSERVENRRLEYRAAERRRHIRKCLYGLLLALMLFALGAVAVVWFQHRQSYRAYYKSMSEQLATGNYDGVFKLYEQAATESPLLIQAGELPGLKLEAERRQALEQEEERKFAAILAELDAMRKTQAPEAAAIQARLAELDGLHPERRSAALSEAARIHREYYRAMVARQQRQNDEGYLAKVRAFQEELDRFQDALRRPGGDWRTAETQWQGFQRRLAELKADTAGISPELVKAQTELLALKLGGLSAQFDTATKQRRLLNILTAPDSFQNYAETLEQLPSQAPELADGEWRRALNALPLFRAIARSAMLSGRWDDRAQFQSAADEIRRFARSTPQLEDIESLLPVAYWQENTGRLLEAMKRELGNDYDCYELVFRTADNRIYRFYSAEPPRRENRINSSLPKSISFRTLIRPGAEGDFFAIRVLTDADGASRFQPGTLPGVALPEQFTALVNMNPASRTFPKAEHGEFLNKALRRLESPATPAALERELTALLEELKKADAMNPYPRLELARRLLELLPQCSGFYAMTIEPETRKIDRIVKTRTGNWRLPTEAVEFADEAAAIEHFFAELNPSAMSATVDQNRQLRRLALDRGLSPGGILLADDGKGYGVHWFNHAQGNSELWFFYPDADHAKVESVVVIDRQELGSDNRLPQQLAAKAFAGMVFFTPFDGKATSVLTDDILKSAAAAKVRLQWPASWPSNRRDEQRP